MTAAPLTVQIESTGDRRSAVTKWGVSLGFLVCRECLKSSSRKSKAGSFSIFSSKVAVLISLPGSYAICVSFIHVLTQIFVPITHLYYI